MNKKAKIIVITIFIIIVIVAIACIYVFQSSLNSTSSSNSQNEENIEEITEENTISNEEATNSNSVVSNNTTYENTTNTTTKVNLSNETNDTSSQIISNNSDANVDELKELLLTYSSGIQRISFSGETLESNTILLFIAKQFFDSTSIKQSSLDVDTIYASTVSNINKYLSELTGNNYSSDEPLNSYTNYIGYSSSNNSYIYGSDISVLRSEEYECPSLELTDENNGVYTATANIIRILDNEETNYNITFTFKINSNYTYQKYQILSLKTENKSFYPDNTVHLVDSSSDGVE